MKIDKNKLQELFSYHPKFTEETNFKYETVDKACITLVLELAEVITDPAELTTLLRKVQELKMLAKQAITNESINLKYRDIYIQ